MGKDLRFIFVSNNENLDAIPFCEYKQLDYVSRHNNHMISGIFTYNELKIKIKEFGDILYENEEDDFEFNEKDIFETINVIIKILLEMDKNQLVNILYD